MSELCLVKPDTEDHPWPNGLHFLLHNSRSRASCGGGGISTE